MRDLAQVKRDVVSAIDSRRSELLAFGEDIWRHPEPGYREFRTSRLSCDVLKGLGLPVQEKLAYTGFRSDLDTGKSGPVVAILGEMDSLILPSHPAADPVTGAVHACGHNCHITGLVGAAMGLVGAGVSEELCGKIAFIGAPAEECIEIEHRMQLIREGKIHYVSGKEELIYCGAFDDVDLAYMLHVGGCNIWDGNGILIKKVIFHGKSRHAAGPCGSVNAMSAMTLAQAALGLLRESLREQDRIHGIITHGGDAANIIPDRTEMEYLVRSNTIEHIQEVNEKFDRAVSHAAQALGATAEIITVPGDMPMREDRQMFEVYKKVTGEFLPEVKIGDIFVNMGSTDMGDVSCIVPALHGGVPGCAGTGHGIDYRIVDPEKAYVTNAKMLAVLAVELLYGDGTLGRKIAAGKKDKLSVRDYLAQLKQFTTGM